MCPTNGSGCSLRCPRSPRWTQLSAAAFFRWRSDVHVRDAQVWHGSDQGCFGDPGLDLSTHEGAPGRFDGRHPGVTADHDGPQERRASDPSGRLPTRWGAVPGVQVQRRLRSRTRLVVESSHAYRRHRRGGRQDPVGDGVGNHRRGVRGRLGPLHRGVSEFCRVPQENSTSSADFSCCRSAPSSSRTRGPDRIGRPPGVRRNRCRWPAHRCWRRSGCGAAPGSKRHT